MLIRGPAVLLDLLLGDGLTGGLRDAVVGWWLAALLATVVVGAFALAWRRPERRGRALVMAALAVLALGVGAWLSRHLRLAGRGASAGLSAADLPRVDNAFRAIEDGDRETPRDSWDPDYVVSMLGRDPQRILAWVRDYTIWIPYRGELRGPVGVLQDRQGDSLDRALLLAALLEKAGQTVRLAHGQLTQEQALQLLPRLIARQAAVSSAGSASASVATPLDPGLIREAASQYNLDAAAIAQRVAGNESAVGRTAAELRSRVRDQAARLLRAVPHPDAVSEWQERFAQALDALRDHWWVQQKTGDGWTDLDVLAPRGAALALPAQRDTLGQDELDAAPVHHEIAIRVVTEQWSAGHVSERTAFEHVLRPAEHIGEPIVLQFWPVEWMSDTAQRVVTGDLRANLLGQRAWAATLFVGRDAVARAPILDTGDDPDAPARGGPMAGLGNAMAQALSSAAGEPQDTIGKVLSAVWLDYEIRAPGVTTLHYRRTVFDLVGPAARARSSPAIVLDDARREARGYALMMRTEILPLVARLSPEYVTHLTARSVLGKRELLHAALRGPITPGTPAVDSLLDRASTTLTPLYGLAAARLEWSPYAGSIFLDRPDLLTRHQYPSWGKSGLVYHDAIDVVANQIGVSLAAPDAFRVRLTQGVLDTNAEALLQITGAAPGNTGDAFRNGDAWQTLAPRDVVAADGLDLPDDVRGRIRANVAAGYIVVAPHQPLPAQAGSFAGWWRVDPATGDAIGLGANGWGFGPGGEESFLVSLRARLASPLFWAMYRRFALAFATDYFFCLSMATAGGVANGGLGGVKLGIVTGIDQCGWQSVIVAGVFATAPLLAIYAGSLAAARAARAAALAEAEFEAAEAAGRGRGLGGGGGAGAGEGGGSGPGLGGAGGGRGTGGRGSPGPGSGGPGSGVPGEGPGAPKTQDMGKTSPDFGNDTWHDPRGTPAAPRANNLGEAEQNVARAQQQFDEASQASHDATKDFVDYRQNKPNPGRGWPGDPSNWDPTVDQALENDMLQKQGAAEDAADALAQAEADLARQQANARRAPGQSGLGGGGNGSPGPAPQGGAPPPGPGPQGGGQGAAPPPPNFPGCPPNCGNQNLTGPAASVQVGVNGVGGSGSH